MQIKVSQCEKCLAVEKPVNLYVDIGGGGEWSLVCQDCFYREYGANPKQFYDKIMKLDKKNDKILSEKKFNQTEKARLPIGNSLVVPFEGINHPGYIEMVAKKVVDNNFQEKKMKAKFANAAIQITPELLSPNLLHVVYVAHCKFNNWLEYLEHEAYMLFRKEIKDTVFQ